MNARALAEKISRGGGPRKNQDREIALITALYFISGVLGVQWFTPRAHLKGTLHQESRVKK